VLLRAAARSTLEAKAKQKKKATKKNDFCLRQAVRLLKSFRRQLAQVRRNAAFKQCCSW